MAATAAVVVAAAAAGMGALAAGAQADAAQGAAIVNAQNAEYNAELTKKRALDDEKKFRQAFMRDQASNVARIGASGVRLEGSPLDLLYANNQLAEEDAQNIRMGGQREQSAYLREAQGYRIAGAAAGRAGTAGAAASLLSGTANTIQTGSQMGAF